MKQDKSKKQGKLVYLLALLPLLSAGMNLLLMRFGMAESFHPVGLLALGVFVLLWAAAGTLFAKNGVALARSLVIFHSLPILTSVIYSLLVAVGTVIENTDLAGLGEVIGVLGMGVFGIFGTVMYSLIPLNFFEVYVNLIFSMLVFAAGFALSPFGTRAAKR